MGEHYPLGGAIYIGKRRAVLLVKFVFALACIALGSTTLSAYPVSFVVNGTLGPVISGGTSLFPSGTTFSMSGSGDSTSSALSSVLITIGPLSNVAATNATVSVSAGTPGTLSITATIQALSLTFAAVAKVTPGLTSSSPYAFGSETIVGNSNNPNGSIVSYGGTTTIVQAIASGTVSATSSAPTLTTNGPLNFSYQLGGTSPASQTLTVSGGSGIAFNAAASSAGWLSVSPNSGATPGNLGVSVNTTGLAAGTYNGSITISSTQGVAPPPVAVQLVVSPPALPTITANPSILPPFAYQLLGTPPAAQSISLTGGNGLAFTASGPSWLTVTPSGTTPGPISVSVNTAGLTAQTYTGSIAVSIPGAANTSINVPVSLNVTAAPTLSSTKTSLSFSFQTGGAAPASQNIGVNAAGGNVTYTAVAAVQTPGGGNWLAVGAGGTTPGSLSVSVNPGSLPAGTYSGSVTISSTHASNNVVVPVTLTISSQPVLTPTPTSLSFSFTTGGSTPAGQNLHIASGGSPLNYTLSTTGGSWLSLTLTSGSTPGDTTVNVNPAGLTAGTYNGAVNVTAAGAGNSPLSVPVTLTVSAQPTLSPAPASFTFNYQVGGTAPSPQQLTVNASGGTPLSYTLAASGGAWLSTGSGGMTNGAPVSVSANPAGLTPGTYSGWVTITAAASNSPLKVPVTFNVTAAASITVAPSVLQFVYQTGGSAPAAQSFTVGGTAGLQYSVAASTSTGGGWLTAAPGGVTPGTVTVRVNAASLAAGTYTGTVTVTPSGASTTPQTVTVSLTVSAQPLLAVTPAQLTFSVAAGSSAPAAQQVSIDSSGSPLNFAVATSTGWLTVTPGSGSTLAKVGVTVNPANMAPGTYAGTIVISASSASNAPIDIKVAMTITAPGPSLKAVSDSASYLTGSLSPAGVVSLWGTGLGPKNPAVFQLGAGNTVANILAGTQVFFGSTAATLLMVSDQQINAIVPYEVAGNAQTMVHVEYQGVKSNEIPVHISNEAPALFTSDLSGKGQGAILNQDYRVNSAGNPAAKGSIVMLYGEGGGQTDPPGTDGTVTGNILAKLVAPVTVQVGGLDAEVLFAGAAPGLVTGVMQINVRIPEGVPSGNAAVVVSVGGVKSQPGVTVAVR